MSRRPVLFRSAPAVPVFVILLLVQLGSRSNCHDNGRSSGSHVAAVEVGVDASQREDNGDTAAAFDPKVPPTPPPDDDGSAAEDANDGRKCDCYAPPRGASPRGNGGGGGGARLAYLISAHNARTLDDASYLFRAIRYPSTIVVVHLDTKVSPEVYENSTLRREIEACPCGADVHVDSLFSPAWGEWSMNDPTHWAMDVLVSHPRFRDKWDVFLNLSGDTMPVLTPDVMAALFDPDEKNPGPLAGSNFVTSSNCETGFVPTNVWQFPKSWHKRVHYVHTPEGDYVGDSIIEHVDDDGVARNTTMTTYFGSQWMALLPDFVEYLVNSLKREDSLPSMYKDDMIDLERLMSDETYIATILMNVHPYNDTLPEILPGGNLASLPSMYAMRYERMDEHYPTAFGLVPIQQRYDVPNSSLCDKPRTWGPYFLGVYDLSNIRHSGALFVRKVSVHLDPNLVHMLPVRSHDELPDIQWPDEVQMSEKVDWGKRKAAYRAKMKAEAEEKDRRAKRDKTMQAKEHEAEEGGSGDDDEAATDDDGQLEQE